MATITLSLISHTNVGKTTLARTLLRRDVGEVLDQAHVTEVSEAHELAASGEGRLLLWDTPGLGDSARLVARLRKEGNPLGWLLHQVWDRSRDRPLYSSQEAVRNIKEDADVVLYLVNAAEHPEDAGYVAYELELLTWIGKPVIVLLNQMGEAVPGVGDDEGSSLQPWPGNDAIARWDAAMREWPIVKHVLPLDAFTRCWVQEGVLLKCVESVLPPKRQPLMRSLAEVWRQRSLAVFDESAARIGAYLAGAAADQERLSGERAGRAEKRRAMRALATRLDVATRDLMDALLDLHTLQGRFQEDVRTRIAEDFRMPGEAAWSSGGAAVFGAAMGGAAGGVAADIITGGLSFGAGAITGALLGAMGAAGLLKGYQLVSGIEEPVVRWSDDFVRELTEQTVLRYLAIAHFGRGRGEWRELGHAQRWSALVARVLASHAGGLADCIALARDAAGLRVDAAARTTRLVRDVLREVLSTGYPQAADVFSRSSR